MKFFLDIVPPTVTAQEHQVKVIHGRPFFYNPANVKAARVLLKSVLLPFKPQVPLNGPIGLKVLWIFPTKEKKRYGKWRITRPDTDNLQKMLKDCMTELGFWKDDAQVCRETAEKSWSKDLVGIGIEINQIETEVPEVPDVKSNR